jgi:hypothetical protein
MDDLKTEVFNQRSFARCPFCRELRQDDEEASKSLICHATAGKPWAQHELGVEMLNEKGNAQTIGKALHWLELALAHKDLVLHTIVWADSGTEAVLPMVFFTTRRRPENTFC